MLVAEIRSGWSHDRGERQPVPEFPFNRTTFRLAAGRARSCPLSLLVASRTIVQMIKPLPEAHVGQATARTEGTDDDAREHDADATPNHPRRVPGR
jgi:hypothetical protein